MLVKYVCSDCYPEDSPYKCEFWSEYADGMLFPTLCPYGDVADKCDWKMTKKYRKLLKKKEK